MHIHVITPSSCINPELIEHSASALKHHGIEVSYAQHLFAQHRYLAARAEDRILDIIAASQDDAIDAIWCGRGGTGAAQLLPNLNCEYFKRPLIGYSDSTTLLNFIAKHGGEAIHGAVFQEIANKNLTAEQQVGRTYSDDAAAVFELLKNPTQKTIYPVQKYLSSADDGEKENQHLISGKILGGNLCTLASLQGTSGALELNEKTILMLEDVGESYYRIERYLVQILQSVDVKNLSAVVLGDFYQCPQNDVPHSLAEIFAEHLQPLQIPLYQCDWFGHGKKNRPFWIGRQGVIQANELII